MILNLTQHLATIEQKEAGVIDLAGDDLVNLKSALIFDDVPSFDEIYARASRIAKLAVDQAPTNESLYAMIGGAPYLMGPLEETLRNYGVWPIYAFSIRESIEEKQLDGSIKKTNVFKHIGFVGFE